MHRPRSMLSVPFIHLQQSRHAPKCPRITLSSVRFILISAHDE